MYDVIIIGAGTAGKTAAVLSSEKKLKVLIVEKNSAGFQASPEDSMFSIEKLNQQFADQIKKKLIEFQPGQEVVALEKNVVSYSAETKSGQVYYGRSAIIATGKNQKTQEGNTIFDLLTYKDPLGRIKVEANMNTNVAGIFAAGEVTQLSSQDVLISAGQGAIAAVAIWAFLRGE